MNFANFIRIEREEEGRTRHYVVHTRDPKFSIEIIPDDAAPDHVGKGTIKAVRLPNSWAGNYSQCAKLITAAQEFFNQSFAEPVPKGETRRFQA
ncbi:hypothetical protein [Rariglobus hedericola]|uniref:Uncharacterized protein n=1 Tax=Rariglobus hedericola TaxID=2597822 RepID=A0A556QS59_9BACT|nr:hypothetical protein [Rariglobus hedericola]TSJ79477.1 hypothetical protein FPL22_09370 [Rariglobus hedericola]